MCPVANTVQIMLLKSHRSEAADGCGNMPASGCSKNERKHFALHRCVKEGHSSIIHIAVSSTDKQN